MAHSPLVVLGPPREPAGSASIQVSRQLWLWHRVGQGEEQGEGFLLATVLPSATPALLVVGIPLLSPAPQAWPLASGWKLAGLAEC